MFSYIDPTVRERLIAQGKLIRIDADGQATDPHHAPEPGAQALSILGPIPLPLERHGRQYEITWYASVRHTELSKTQELADELRERDGQQSFAVMASSMAVNSVLLLGDPDTWENPLVRVHSSCLTGDVFGSERCECGPQFISALERIADDAAGGMIVYMSGHEGARDRALGQGGHLSAAGRRRKYLPGESLVGFAGRFTRFWRCCFPVKVFHWRQAVSPADQQPEKGRRPQCTRTVENHTCETRLRRRDVQQGIPCCQKGLGPQAEF